MQLERHETAAPAFTPRELATVLAALRYWQREGWRSEGHEHDIATCGDTLAPLNEGEIDAMCERLNMASQFPRLAIIVEGGVVQDIVCDRPEMVAACYVIDYDTDDGDAEHLTGVPQQDASDAPAYISDHGQPSPMHADYAEAIRRMVEG